MKKFTEKVNETIVSKKRTNVMCDPINEEQFPETKLSTFMLNGRMDIIITVCFFLDGLEHRCKLA